MKIIVEPHNPGWLIEFASAKKDLENILTGIPILSIEHIGSTSIPGLLAKPVLDIDIIVTRENLTATSGALVNAGYTALGELGIPGRFVFRQPGFQKDDQAGGSRGPDGQMRRNTYVTVDGCLSLKNHMDLKRVLLEDERLRDEYAEMKRRLVDGGVEDVDEYCTGKNEIILKILKKAGWTDEDLEELRKVNR